MSLKAAIELNLLSLGKLENLWGISDAIPEVLDELDALGHCEMTKVREGMRHG